MPKSKVFQRKGGYLALDRQVYDSPAYTSLSCTERAVLADLNYVYAPGSRELIAMSVRQIAAKVRINKDTAAKSLKRLAEVGFIEVVEESNWINGRARIYRLTFKPYKGRNPSDEWSKYQNDGPNSSDEVSG
jgi:DNA-binding MarR family transcriptional regulator